jgi:GNAT superfamily N-acetyltransferase
MVELREVSQHADERELAAWAEAVMASVRYVLATSASVRHELPTSPHAVAVEEGRVLGTARIRDHVAQDGSASALVTVAPRERGRGIGSALLSWAVERATALGASRLTGVAEDEGGASAVLRHWGFELGGESRMSWVDPRGVPGPDELGDREGLGDLRVVSGDQVDPARVWECHQLAAPDDPSGFSRQMPLEAYLELEWGDPLLRPDLSHVVLDGDECVAFSLLRVAGRRGWSSMTAVRPSHRGRGLSLTAKAATLRAAAAAGVRRSGTGNAATNAPVLALNAHLGYQLLCTVRSFERTLVAGARP